MRLPIRSVAGALLIAVSCSGSPAAETTTTTALATTVPTTAPPPTTTTSTTMPPAAVSVALSDAPPGLVDAVTELYEWVADQRNPEPSIPAGMLAGLGSPDYVETLDINGEAFVAELPVDPETETQESVATVLVGDDTLLAVDDGSGWRIVGGTLKSVDAAPYHGEGPRFILVLGSDARPGQNQQRYRADSIHVLSLTEDRGAIVGFPRDSWVDSSAGPMKFTNLMAGRGPQIMLETATDLTELPLEGYIVTGFLGFTNLINDFGGVDVAIESYIRGGLPGFRDFAAGILHLTGAEALQLARIRKTLPDGDFGRSRNHGVIIQGALGIAQVRGVQDLPELLKILATHTWTDLNAEQLITFMAAAYEVDPDDLTNVVLPGSVGTTSGGQSVVFIGDGAQAVFVDVADGTIDD